MAGVSVLFVASEIFPMAKTGGLADVCGALPAALAELDTDIRLLMPGYPSALELVGHARPVAQIDDLLGTGPLRVLEGRTPDSGLPVWLIDSPALFRRDGGLYQQQDGGDWPDNAKRFAVFCHAAARIALGQTAIGWRPDIVHCHDWHTGLVPLLLAAARQERPASLFTIHNLAFQGVFPYDTFRELGLPSESFSADGIEFHGNMSFIKSGIRYADRLTTVSPTYAQEIQTPEFGSGLDGLLRQRRSDLVGILNGVDTNLWNPALDSYLASTYSANDLSGKHRCKAELQRELGFEQDAEAPLVIMASRLTPQKMADVVLSCLPGLLAREQSLQLVVLGRGDAEIEQGFRAMAGQFAGRVSTRIGYEEPQAHRLHAGGDVLLHRSRFEPCGLTQLYAMAYGTVPIVRRVGGLADTVVDASKAMIAARRSTGFVFEEPEAEDMIESLDKALDLYMRPEVWRRLQRQAMNVDFGWTRSATRYRALYHSLVPDAAKRSSPDARQGRAPASSVLASAA